MPKTPKADKDKKPGVRIGFIVNGQIVDHISPEEEQKLRDRMWLSLLSLPGSKAV